MAKNILIWIDGGWAVDARLGEETRPHGDVDIVVQTKDVARLRTILEYCSYTDRVDDETKPWNFVILLERIHSWAILQNDIRLCIIIGSRARTDRPSDEFSDLDLLMFTTDSERYISNADWLSHFGHHFLTFVEGTAVGDFMERRVLFESGLDVDFIPLPLRVLESSFAAEIAGVLQRGYRVLLDKDGLAVTLTTLTISDGEHKVTNAGPTEKQYLQIVNDFLYHAVWSAKKLCRGELWTAKMCCDGYMKRQLLQAIEWHRHVTGTDSIDTWHEGRFLDSWADPQVLSKLHVAFALYEVGSVWRALDETVDLFRCLCEQVGNLLGYTFPASGAEYADGLLREYQSVSRFEPPKCTAVPPANSECSERSGTLHHVEINVSNLQRSSEFWGWLLSYLGYETYQSWADGRSWRKGETYLVLVQTEHEYSATGYHRRRTGLNHVALHAGSRKQVDELTELLRERGTPILYEDRHPYSGGPEHYAVFFEDPDRIKLEVVGHKR